MSQTAPDQLRSTQSRMGPPPPWAPPPQSNPAGGRPAFTPNYSSHQRPETKPPGTFNVPVINGSQHANAPSGHQQMKSASQLITPSSENYQQYLRENRRSGGNLNQHANKPRPASNFVEYSLPRNSGRHQQQQLLNGQTQSYSRRDVNSVIYEVPPVDYNNQLRPTAPPRRHLPNGETQGVTLPLPDSRKSAYHNGNERIVERLTIEYPPYAQRMEPSRNCHTAAPPVAPKPKLAAAVAVRHQEIESSKMWWEFHRWSIGHNWCWCSGAVRAQFSFTVITTQPECSNLIVKSLESSLNCM